MKKIMLINEKNMKQWKGSNQMNKSFLKMSKSESFLLRKPKKSSSIQKQKNELSKNDQRVTIYCDKQSFIVEYSVLSYGLKCDCHITEGSYKRNTKAGKIQSLTVRHNQIKKKSKLQITINKEHLAIIKTGVQHIFPLPTRDTKHDFLKVVLTENWQPEQFNVGNKKTKMVEGQLFSKLQNNCDQIFPLKNITQADQFRKWKLLKSDSKVKIAWGNTQKDTSLDLNNNQQEILSFTVTKKLSETASKRCLFDQTRQIHSSAAFLRKSLNECDQTRDSQEEHTMEQNSLLQSIGMKSGHKKGLSINFDLWNNETPIKAPLISCQLQRKKDDLIHTNRMDKRSNAFMLQRFFK